MIARSHDRLEGRHENILERFLVDGDLNCNIEPWITGILGFGNDGTILGIGLKGLPWDKAFANGTDTKVQIPKQTKKGQDRQKHFHHDTSGTGIIPNG